MPEIIQIFHILSKIISYFGYAYYEDEDGDLMYSSDGSDEAIDEMCVLYDVAFGRDLRPIHVLKSRVAIHIKNLLEQIGTINHPKDINQEEKDKIYETIENIIKDLLFIAGTIDYDGNYELGFWITPFETLKKADERFKTEVEMVNKIPQLAEVLNCSIADLFEEEE